MRSVFQCAVCGVHYLPPEGLRWSDGSAASPLWCDVHHVAAQRHGITAPEAATAAALLAARLRDAAPPREGRRSGTCDRRARPGPAAPRPPRPPQQAELGPPVRPGRRAVRPRRPPRPGRSPHGGG